MIDITLPNLQILANAGSGKTHTLVTRIIRLLMLGVQPRRIIALTFTRKAAGEFLSKLLQRLAAAALNPQAAAQLSDDIRLNHSETDYQELLRRVVQDLGRLQLTTLDSFFHRIVSAFPQELGLSGSPKLLDTHAEELAGKDSLRHALEKLSKPETALLLQSLLERDEGSAPGSVSGDLSTFRSDIHDSFLDHPEAESWGNPERIWGKSGNFWKPLSPSDLQTCRNILLLETGSPHFSEKAQGAWNQLQLLTRGTKPNSVIAQIFDSLDRWREGTGSLKYYRESYEISQESSLAASTLVEHYLHECTEYRLREARAIHHLLSLYEKEYDAEVRSRGMLTFSDVTRLLQPDPGFVGIGRDSKEEAAFLRLQLDERLDALFDHWLLDEFQDTSRSQYRALENILDEVISEAARGGERSFFCVGDIKQAIYGWRKGDSRLFDELHERYHRGSGLIREPLNISWRSSKEILETLNAIFGSLDTTAPTLPEEVRERWRSAWTSHQCTDQKLFLPGYFAWKLYDPKKEEALEEEVISLLKTMQSRLREGMTIALLVRSGREANDWLETLRFAGIEALSESNPPVGRDNPVAAAIRSALSLSVHPGDRFALNHLSMEPLREIFFPQGELEKECAELIRKTAELLARGGFSAVTEWLLNKLAPLIHDDFSRERAAALKRAALRADHSRLTDTDDFLSFLEKYEEPGRAAPHAVQIMTIHKAKGLEYDMVLLPLSGTQKAIDSLGSTQIEEWRNEHKEPFLMKLPAEEIRNVRGNEALAQAAQHKRDEGAFEELCVWYVALSRAKRALYLFTPEPKKLDEEKCPSFPQLVAAGLKNQTAFQNGVSDDLHASLGDPEWFERLQPRGAEPERDPTPASISLPSRASALEKSRPSDTGHEILRGSQAFLPSNAAALGSEIHAYFESISWLEENSILPSSLSAEARELLEPCLQQPALRELFQKPKTPLKLWREQRFDLLREGRWVSGCFDRVVIFLDEKGRAISADLFDFKTDQGGREKLLLNYRSQLESYRQALSQILGLPEEKVRMILLHLRSKDPVIFLDKRDLEKVE